MVLYYLDNSFDKTMRRIDLAEKIWLTASGITRLLLPMEKIGLVKKQTNENDARVSLVSITDSGKLYLDDAIDRLNYITDEIIEWDLKKEIKKIDSNLKSLYKNF